MRQQNTHCLNDKNMKYLAGRWILYSYKFLLGLLTLFSSSFVLLFFFYMLMFSLSRFLHKSWEKCVWNSFQFRHLNALLYELRWSKPLTFLRGIFSTFYWSLLGKLLLRIKPVLLPGAAGCHSTAHAKSLGSRVMISRLTARQPINNYFYVKKKCKCIPKMIIFNATGSI